MSNCSFCSNYSCNTVRCNQCCDIVCNKCIWQTDDAKLFCTKCMNLSDNLMDHIFSEILFKNIDTQSLRGQTKIIKISNNNISSMPKNKKISLIEKSTSDSHIPQTDMNVPKEDTINEIKVIRADLKEKRKEIKELTDKLRNVESKLFN